MTQLHVMLDLETWSSKPNATIISIGAVKFDPAAGTIVDRFHVGIDPAASGDIVPKLFHIDASTIQWWMSPDQDAARKAWQELKKLDLATALDGFAGWFGETSLPVWGNGATFDNVVLSHSYEVMGLRRPWGFRDDRCYRTLKNLAPEVNLPKAHGVVAHDALDDATMQAHHAMALLRHLGALGLQV